MAGKYQKIEQMAYNCIMIHILNKRSMKKLFFLVLICLTGGQTFSQGINIPGLQHPESVAYDGEFYYVSNIGLEPNPTAEDGDGFITKISADGLIVDRLFLPRRGKLNAPKGMSVIGKILFVTDINKVYGFTLNKKRKKVFEIEIPESNFLNDLEPLNQHEILVSAPDVDAIFKIDILQKTYTKLNIEGSVNGPNGLDYDEGDNTLYVVGVGTNNQANGKIGKVKLDSTSMQYEILSDYQGHLDGLFIYQNTLVFTDWIQFGERAGALKRLNLGTNEVTEIVGKIEGPADIYYNYETGQLWMPVMMGNRVFRMDY